MNSNLNEVASVLEQVRPDATDSPLTTAYHSRFTIYNSLFTAPYRSLFTTHGSPRVA